MLVDGGGVCGEVDMDIEGWVVMRSSCQPFSFFYHFFKKSMSKEDMLYTNKERTCKM